MTENKKLLMLALIEAGQLTCLNFCHFLPVLL